MFWMGGAMVFIYFSSSLAFHYAFHGCFCMNPSPNGHGVLCYWDSTCNLSSLECSAVHLLKSKSGNIPEVAGNYSFRLMVMYFSGPIFCPWLFWNISSICGPECNTVGYAAIGIYWDAWGQKEWLLESKTASPSSMICDLSFICSRA